MNRYVRKYLAKKYLLRIILSINLFIMAFMLISLLAAYFYAEKISLQSQREANEKVLSQINYNIGYMNETVKNMAISIFYDPDMAQLLYSRTEDEFEDPLRIQKLDKTVGYNSFLHSVVIYNSQRGTYFIGGDPAVKNDQSNIISVIDEYLDGGKKLYKMQLMPIPFIPDLAHPARKQELFSLYMYDSLNEYNRSESAVIIQIKPEWLFQKMEFMNRVPGNRSSRLFIFDQNQEIHSPSGQTAVGAPDLKSEVYGRIADTGNNVSQFTYTGNGEKQIVNYMTNSSNNWVIVAVQPYEAVFAAIDQLKIVFLTVAAVSFVLALFASLFVSQKLYSPIELLMKQAGRLPGFDAGNVVVKDEIGYMSNVYNQLADQLVNEKTKQEINHQILGSYYLRNLITDSTAFSPNDLEECRRKKYVKVNLGDGVVIGVLKIDSLSLLSGATQEFNVKLFHFAISNIVSDLLSEESGELDGEVVDIRGGHLVLLFDVSGVHTDVYAQISRLLGRAQDIVKDYYHITFTVALSHLSPSYREITFHYKRALDHLAYRMNYGTGSVLTPQLVKRNLENEETQVPPDLERKLTDAIKVNRREAVYQLLDEIRGRIAAMHTDAVIQSVIHLSTIVKQTVREINQNKLSPLPIDLGSMDQLVFEKETLDEIFAEFARILGGIFIEHKQWVENKDHVLVDTIKEVLHANYSNPNIGLQDVADLLKMSPAYLGRIFKKYENTSVAEYINEFRLQQSLAYLEKNKLPINEVVEKVGFNSQSYFFKMFKKRFGTTPKEYRIKRSLQ